MIFNATITNYQLPDVADGDGNITPGASNAYSQACTMDAPTRAQRMTLGAKIENASAVLYVPMGRVVRPETGGVYTIKYGTQDPVRLLVIQIVDRLHGSQSHYEVFVQSV